MKDFEISGYMGEGPPFTIFFQVLPSLSTIIKKKIFHKKFHNKRIIKEDLDILGGGEAAPYFVKMINFVLRIFN